MERIVRSETTMESPHVDQHDHSAQILHPYPERVIHVDLTDPKVNEDISWPPYHPKEEQVAWEAWLDPSYGEGTLPKKSDKLSSEDNSAWIELTNILWDDEKDLWRKAKEEDLWWKAEGKTYWDDVSDEDEDEQDSSEEDSEENDEREVVANDDHLEDGVNEEDNGRGRPGDGH